MEEAYDELYEEDICAFVREENGSEPSYSMSEPKASCFGFAGFDDTVDRTSDGNEIAAYSETFPERTFSVEHGSKFGGSASSSGIPINRMALNDHKAGMSGLDKEKINTIIYEASKGSLFFENERKKEARVKERVSKLLSELKNISDQQKTKALKEIDEKVNDLEASRDLSRTIVHIDMDAFYAAVEMRDNPELRDKPMAVGGMGMLSTSNYAARRYGVRAGMPGFIGKKLCPDLILIRPHFAKYRAVSDEVKDILKQYDPNFSMASMDEAYLDITDYVKRLRNEKDWEEDNNSTSVAMHRDAEVSCNSAASDSKTASISQGKAFTLPEMVVDELRGKIYLKTQLTASAGIASNTMLAKICSDRNKPNGQFFLPPYRDEILDFIQKLPIRKVFGIGRVSEQILNAIGVETCKDMYESRAVLKLLFSPIAFDSFLRISLGIASSTVCYDAERKSISTETTFGKLSKAADIISVCENLCLDLVKNLNSEDIQGNIVTVKFKLTNFEVRSRSKSLTSPIYSFEDISRIAKDIINHEIQVFKPKPFELRLLGIRLSDLSSRKGNAQNKIDLFLKRNPGASEFDSGAFLTLDPKQTLSTYQDVKGKSSCSTSQQLTNISSSSTSTHHSTARGLDTGKETVECPVCFRTLPASVDINSHVDTCLSKKAIREFGKEDFKDLPFPAKKRRKATDESTRKKSTLLKYFTK